MAITTTALGRSYLAPNELPLILKNVEGYLPVAYADGRGIVTIGIGIALQNADRTQVLAGNLALVLRKLGVFAASDAGAPPGETTLQRNQRYQTIINDFAGVIQAKKTICR